MASERDDNHPWVLLVEDDTDEYLLRGEWLADIAGGKLPYALT